MPPTDINLASTTQSAISDDEEAYAISYWLDISDVIVDIGPGWEAFAQENNASSLDARRIIGRSLFDFIEGDVTKMYIRTIIQAARLVRRPLLRPYRCDSPQTRRYMEMRLTLEDSGLLKWEHRTLRTEPLHQALDFRSAGSLKNGKCIVRCSMCNRLKSHHGWQEPDDAKHPPPQPDGKIFVIYGVCPDCLATPLKPISGHAAHK